MEIIHKGWLDMSSTKSNSKNWLKKSVTKPWKKRLFILCREEVNNDKVSLMAYEKEEHCVKQKAKKVLDLYPKYKVARKSEMKGKEFVFQVSNEEESWFLAADNQRVLDLWVIQIQMQTKLSRAIAGRIFSVEAANTRPLQRIGAKDQRCLLHFTRWGLTLALQESRSVLSLWPLDTIRNYECTGTGQFILEAGRRSPMGEGKYAFFTQDGEDEVMFNVIDVFVTARLNSKANLSPNKQKEGVTDDDILVAFDKHHSCVLGTPPPEVFSDSEDYAHLGCHEASRPVAMGGDKPPSYDTLARTGEIKPAASTSVTYDQLDRTSSWGSKSVYSEAGYDTIDRSKNVSDVYDHFTRVTADQGAGLFQDKGHYSRFGSYSDDKACISPGNYPLTHHEPSIPNILESPNCNSGFDQRFGSFSSTCSDVVYSNTTSPEERGFLQQRQNSTGSGLKQRKTTREAETPLPKDEAPALPARTNLGRQPSLSFSRPVPKPGDPSMAKMDRESAANYQNADAAPELENTPAHEQSKAASQQQDMATSQLQGEAISPSIENGVEYASIPEL